jgi:hypothetical protein
MAKAEAKVEKKPVITVHPIAVEGAVIADIRQDGQFVQQVKAAFGIPEINFNHGTTIKELVEKSHKALEEKYLTP